MCAQHPHALAGYIDVFDQQAFGQLQLQAVRAESSLFQQTQHQVHKAGMAELPGTDVDRQGEMGHLRLLGPLIQQGAGFA